MLDLELLRKTALEIAKRLGDPNLADDALSTLVELSLLNPQLDLSRDNIDGLRKTVGKALQTDFVFKEVADSTFDKNNDGFSVIELRHDDRLNAEEIMTDSIVEEPEDDVFEANPMDDPMLSWEEDQMVACRFTLKMTYEEIAYGMRKAVNEVYYGIKEIQANARPSEAKKVFDQLLEVEWLVI